MLHIQVMYRSNTANNRGRNIQTIEVPIRNYTTLPTNNMLMVTLRAKDSNGIWQPVRRINEKDHVALVLFFRDNQTHWDLIGWDDSDIDPIARSNPFTDRSQGLRFPYPLRGAVQMFDGVAVTPAKWADALAEMDERQREETD